MKVFGVFFGSVLTQYSTRLSIISMKNVGRIILVYDPAHAYIPDWLRNVSHASLYSISAPRIDDWKLQKEFMIQSFVSRNDEDNIVYVDLDVFASPSILPIIHKTFLLSFDVAYTSRGFRSKWGVINTGVVYFKNTFRTHAWLNTLYYYLRRSCKISHPGKNGLVNDNNSLLTSCKDPQIVLDNMLNITVKHRGLIQYATNNIVVNLRILSTYPHNMLKKHAKCSIGFNHYHGPYKQNIDFCCKTFNCNSTLT